MRKIIIRVLCTGLLSLGMISTAGAAVMPLEGRLPATPGGMDYQAYYDPNLNITWAQDANINGFDIWDNQVAWVASLTIGGVSDWRLPSADVNGDNNVVNCRSGGVAGCTDNEMGFLFWEEGITAAAPGPFSNVITGDYWFGTEFAPDPTDAWRLFFLNGFQGAINKDDGGFAWAVHSGDVSAVPVPAAVWLFGSGLLGLLGLARRKRAV